MEFARIDGIFVGSRASENSAFSGELLLKLNGRVDSLSGKRGRGKNRDVVVRVQEGDVEAMLSGILQAKTHGDTHLGVNLRKVEVHSGVVKKISFGFPSADSRVSPE